MKLKEPNLRQSKIMVGVGLILVFLSVLMYYTITRT